MNNKQYAKRRAKKRGRVKKLISYWETRWREMDLSGEVTLADVAKAIERFR